MYVCVCLYIYKYTYEWMNEWMNECMKWMKRMNAFVHKHKLETSSMSLKYLFNQFFATGLLLYLLKTSQKTLVFWSFQGEGIEKVYQCKHIKIFKTDLIPRQLSL